MSQAWQEVRADSDIQFEPVDIPEIPPPEPGWFAKFMEWLAELFSPVGGALAQSWPVLKWILLAFAIACVAIIIYRLVGPGSLRRSTSPTDEAIPEWRPDAEESLALLGDADALAAQGRYDEATHLLLQRSVSHIASARPTWVEPSSTARELAALPALPEGARAAFTVITERVERSLFALKHLGRDDWEIARAAYADFALARLDGATL